MPKRGWQARRIGTAGLGLFALLLQLFLSFGHVHVGKLLAPRPLLLTAVGKSAPADQQQIPNGIPDDDCQICTTMHMAASGLLPAPPFVVLPAPFGQVAPHSFIEEFNLGVTRHILFQTRAPPIV